MRRSLTIAFLSAVLLAPPAMAAPDALIEGAKLCTRHLPRYEREYGIPTHLLSAIASTESGRYHEGLKINIPWPWTINAGGKGYYYRTKTEAIIAARKFQARGIKSFDVGCMQVNMLHHGHAFKSLEEAFEPQTNIAYAASFLRNLYQSGRSWKQAASDYHSKTPSRGNQYAGLVYGNWYTIIDKLRAAKLQVPASSVTAMNDMKSTSRASVGKSIKVASAKTARALPEQKGKKVAAHKSPRMNSVKISKKDNSRENGIVIVRPAIKVVDTPTTVSTVKMQPVALTMAQSVGSEAKPAAGGKKSGPAFVFND